MDSEEVTDAVARAHERLGGIEIEQFGGDNFAVWLCSRFEEADDEGEEDECGWKPSAIAGYEAVVGAIRAHYDAALRRASPPPAEPSDTEELNALRGILVNGDEAKALAELLSAAGLEELAKRCEQATGLEDERLVRQLECEIAKATGYDGGPLGSTTSSPWAWCPHYLRSLDAAMTLVPEGWTRTAKWSVENEGYALVYDPASPDDTSHYAIGRTAALALCAAALRSLALRELMTTEVASVPA